MFYSKFENLLKILKVHSNFWCRCVYNLSLCLKFNFQTLQTDFKTQIFRCVWAKFQIPLLRSVMFATQLFQAGFHSQLFSGWVSISTFFLAGFQFQLFFGQVFNCNFFRQVFNWPQWCLGRSTRSLGSPGTSGEKTQSPVLRGRLTEAAKKLAARKNFIFYICFRSADQILVNLNT